MSKNVTDRIWKMREALVATTPEIFANRARLVTESYRETLGMPYVLRRAKALDKVLRQMDICIAEGELVVGSYAGRPRGCQVYPEYDMAFVIDELDLFEKREADRFVVSEETKAELRALHGDWQGNTIADTALGIFPEEVRESAGDGVFLLTTLRCGIGHIIVDYPLLLREGVRGLKARIAAQRDALDFGDARYGEKLVYYQAADICCDAFVAFAHRFAALAEEQAAAESDATRQAELRLIAQNCRRVPEAPAQNFYEALQAFWLLHLVLHLESSGHSVSPGRFDQYMIPYYAQDLADGATTEAEAEERLHALWLKFFEINKVRDKTSTVAFSGYPMFQNLILGGQDTEGRCAVNALSHLCLDATATLRLPQPSISMRWFYGSPDDFLLHALEVIALGTGLPALFNDEVLIPNMLQMGYSLEEARDYGIVGCSETTGQGNVEPWLTGGFINALKPLELALFEGRDPVLNKQRAFKNPPVESMACFDDFFEAYMAQMLHYLDLNVTGDNILDALHAGLCPTPFESLFIDGCLQNGMTNLEGGARHNASTLEVVGLPNVSDALCAIDTLIYREKKLDWATLKKALQSNFEGYEPVWGMLLNHSEKYGNDSAYPDAMAKRVVDGICAHAAGYRSPRGGPYRIALYSISANVMFAEKMGATPDGRRAGDVLADGGISCAQGRDKKGLTALLNTIVKIDPYKALGSTLLNVRLAPDLLKGDNVYAVADVIKTYFMKKGQHIQFNVFDVAVLRDAQKHPEKYPTLMVRVAGFSVLFTTIGRQLQEDIISRTEHHAGGTAH